ncbi:hypothetical protein UFOVP116_9 [uncultured Caudovirales phage]|uniref:DUF6242 domain-containing protein n=1 Tax=uncultured Caudovirales phage TaxID=2100421 RepID=A0A6J5L7E3_9CAUD|nr:hypothetical protein UFOVP116_9 [uncultured Caudovirales phage]
MSNFDPITFSAVSKLKPEVGTMQLVPEGFISSKYLDSGAVFSPVDYPDLAAAFPNSYPSDVVATTYSLPYNPSSYGAIAQTLGTVVGVYSMDGTPDTHYIIFSTGKVYKSVAGSAPVFHKQITTPLGANAILQPNYVNPLAVNNRIYCGGSGAATAYNIWYPETYFIDLTQDFATVAVTVPRTTFSWRCVYTRYRAATGTYIALGFPNASGTTMAVCTSTDGITFTQVATGIAVNASILAGFTGSPTTWVLSTSSTGVFTSTDGLVWTTRTTTAAFNSLAYSTGNSLFVASVAAVGGALQTSPDGITWTSRPQTTPVCTTSISKVMTNGSDIIAVAQNGQTQYSSTGTAFVGKNIPTILYGGGLFFTSYSASSDNYLVYVGTILNTTNCHYQTQKMTVANYNVATNPTNTGLITKTNTTCLALEPPVFLANGLTGCSVEYTQSISSMYSISGYVTTDGGVNWSPMAINLDKLGYFYGAAMRASIIASDSKFYVIFNTGTGNSTSVQMASSADGINWSFSAVYTNTNQLQGLVAFKNKLYLLTSGGLFVSADDGNTWSTVSGVSWSSGQVLYKTNSVIGLVNLTQYTFNSIDGVNWRTIWSLSQMSGVTQGYVTCGTDRMVVQNATNYTQMYELKGEEVAHTTYAIPAHRAEYQVVGNSMLLYTGGYALVSNNFLNWKTVKIGNGIKLTGYSNNNDWAVINDNFVKLSFDASSRQVPMVASTVNGAKWVVRAKK